jgi:hypothetical protein
VNKLESNYSQTEGLCVAESRWRRCTGKDAIEGFVFYTVCIQDEFTVAASGCGMLDTRNSNAFREPRGLGVGF